MGYFVLALYFLSFFYYTELVEFMRYTTGSPSVQGNRVYLQFDKDVASFVANTCGRQLVVSSTMKDYELCMEELKNIISSIDFTMPWTRLTFSFSTNGYLIFLNETWFLLCFLSSMFFSLIPFFILIYKYFSLIQYSFVISSILFIWESLHL